MMTDEKSPETPKWVKKLLIPALFGGVAGFATSMAAMQFIDSPAVGGLGKSATIAALVGVLYILIGLAVAVGTASPKAGARFLNVEDADELREQKKVLIWSGGGMVLSGLSLIALALAAPDGPVPQALALALGVGGTVVSILVSVVVYRQSDELMRAVTLEASAIGYALVTLVIGVWAMLAHLGYAAAPAPLDLLTLFQVLVLLASFVAAGRRGMLAPR
ncbi:hypothetical protein [Erythrobacter oryzae]|uniref:hypothetical protein n=1 Tax=Erythrobacter oryzae TaxID=3019556 RepID=UPI002554793A|nr:hypothetical protein [Erythrobacter sp. COR-2]